VAESFELSGVVRSAKKFGEQIAAAGEDIAVSDERLCARRS
jgi:hypothetical protein